MRRRAFIGLDRAAAAWALAPGTEESVRLNGVLMLSVEAIRTAKPAPWHSGRSLARRGWTIGRNVRIDYRWSIDITEKAQSSTNTTALGPEVLPSLRAIADKVIG